MDDLVNFLTARLGEDAAAAVAAACVAGPSWAWKTEVTVHDEATDYVTGATGALLADTLGGTEDMAPHIARHDPARVLREVAAKRAILTEHKAVTKLATLTEQELGFLGWYREWLLRHLAAVYSDHPDYLPEWAPAAT